MFVTTTSHDTVSLPRSDRELVNSMSISAEKSETAVKVVDVIVVHRVGR